ncbi:LysE family translocator [Roseibium litorale]|uniref:LysE family transporter n=1 Tax=Roseibium litorale TaxID=2803841 RepID=A0ABR9CIF9_9HYPH|nr:LysE family transporter [Roseibium litorale]MBD8890484.1 LysE family transporter [Roseibium litorale]
MLSFLAAVFFLLITPGPGVLSTAGVGSGFGARAGLRYVSGLWLGNNLVGLAVVSGLAAIVFSVPLLREVLAGLSFLYLLYLAGKIALSGSKIAFIHAERPPGFFGGLALQAINPKAYVVNAALYGGFGFWPDSLGAEILVKFLLLNAVWIPVHLLWLGAGVGLHRLNLSQRSHMVINAAMALSMLAVVVLAALNSF